MLAEVKLDQSLIRGEFVEWHSDSQSFVRCTNILNMVGVVTEPAYLKNGESVGVICQSGICNAIAGEDIPASGGSLGVNELGRAIINDSPSCGIVQVQIYGAQPRVAGDMVVIWLR